MREIYLSAALMHAPSAAVLGVAAAARRCLMGCMAAVHGDDWTRTVLSATRGGLLRRGLGREGIRGEAVSACARKEDSR